MKAQGLRIGNVVMVKGKIDTLNMISDNDFCSENYGHAIWDEDIEFIPLTEEWLLKLGIKRQDHWDETQNIYSIEVPNDYGGYIQGYTSNGELKVCLVGCDDGRVGNFIQYVHQLQNIYFALTGTELELKSPG